MQKVNHESAVHNILSVYNAATTYELQEGQEWYRGDAWQFCLNLGWQIAAQLGQLGQEIEDRHWSKFVAAVVAVGSPKKRWGTNKALAYSMVEQVLQGETVTGHYEAQCKKVDKLYKYFLMNRGIAFSHTAVLDIISKPDAKKTRSFYLNIVGDDTVVTVDGHATLIADYGLGDGTRLAITKVSQPNGKLYDAYEAAYLDAAKIAGVAPAVMQAVTWVTFRRLDIVDIK